MDGNGKQFNLQELVFYFDSEARDRLDTSGKGRKLGLILDLGQKLMDLPDADFEAAVKTMRSLVGSKAKASENDIERQHRQKLNQANQLYTAVAESQEIVDPAAKVSAV